MIVCHCTGTSDQRVRQEVESGARSCSELGQRCEAGTVCGGCVPLLECLLENRNPLGQSRSVAIQGD